MSSHSRLHGSTSYRVPWNYDDEAVEVVRFYTELKKKFLPKILEASSIAHETGIPVMRPMVLEFQDDPMCAFLDRQYMLGSDILVAPVFDETGCVEYYLPAGIWKDVYTDETITLDSGKVFKETRDHLHMPIFIRS
jgi:alpha-D-xyloside xylohydrolase